MPTLDWLNREDAFRIPERVPTRVLRPHAAAPSPVGDAGAAPGNLLVQGDNLEALAALLPFYRGRVKCIFIDPPYKGAQIASMPKEIEKGEVGRLWAERSAGRCLFTVVFKERGGLAPAQQIDAAITGQC